MIENKYDHVVGNGTGMAGNWIMYVLLFLVVIFLLFRRGFDGHDGKDGYGYSGHCNPFCAPKPMNPAQGCVDTCTLDKDIIKTAHKTQEVERYEGHETRELIERNYIQELRDKYSDAKAEIAVLKSERFMEARFGAIERELCRIPKAQEGFAATCLTETRPNCGCRHRECGEFNF